MRGVGSAPKSSVFFSNSMKSSTDCADLRRFKARPENCRAGASPARVVTATGAVALQWYATNLRHENSLVVDLVVLDLAGVASLCAAKPTIPGRCGIAVAAYDLQRLPYPSRTLRARGAFGWN